MALSWSKQDSPRWDADKRALFATVPAGVFDFSAQPDTELLEEWWEVRDESGAVVGYGWMDSTVYGDVEVLVAVHSGAQHRGVGSFVLTSLEQEAAGRGVNYVYNVVRETHPDAERLHDWLSIRGYRGSDSDTALRKHVRQDEPASAPPAPPTPAPEVMAPGHEERGGYVDVADHRY